MISYVSCHFHSALFQNKAARAQESKTDSDTLWTKHESHITNISKLDGGRIATSALDGRVVVWDLRAADLGVNMASLGI
jgi:WD40 repeat protein